LWCVDSSNTQYTKNTEYYKLAKFEETKSAMWQIDGIETATTINCKQLIMEFRDPQANPGGRNSDCCRLGRNSNAFYLGNLSTR
jgi:hypothetical protein